MRPSDSRVAEMAKALGHPARVAILRTLAERSCVCGDVVEVLPLAQSTVSQHLKVLREAGWITGEIDGPRTCYSLDHGSIAELRSVLGPMLEEWGRAPACSTDSDCT